MLLQAFSWNGPFLNNRTGDWIIAAACLLIALFLARPIASGIARLVSAVIWKFSHQKNKKAYSDVVSRPLGNLLALLFLYLAVLRLTWPFNFVIYARPASGTHTAVNLTLLEVADRIFQLLIIIQLGLVIARTIDYIFRMQINRAQASGDTEQLQLFPLMRDVAKILLWTMAFFWVLGSVFSVNIPALIAGLGIGGVAIALAAKESVENFFAAFTILTDKPFQSGDTIRLGTLEGAVERIGFRSTRLRHADGSMFVIPNSNLVSQNLENLSKRIRTRVQLKVLLRNDLPVESLGTLMNTLEDRIAHTENVRTPVSVNLNTFGKSTIELMLSYHLPVPSLGQTEEESIKQDIALKIYAMLSQYGVVEAAKEPDDTETGKGLQDPDDPGEASA
jgi:MscS family membrane protein